ncbi:MAG: segregation/condensation protein A [Alphaproteobacteria bacterium GM7ARS4]|nr:segregation/condensation protein A [Alphaproteobacteria bacterium GM7ARS4]
MPQRPHMPQQHTLFETPCHVALDVYEGPMEVLLHLARDQKVDLLRVKLATLADQYLAFITSVRRLNLEIATEYLVVATWLTWLKSRLLLPKAEQETDDIPAYEQEKTLRLRLRHYDMVQRRAQQLAQRPQQGYDVFVRGRYGHSEEEATRARDDESPLFHVTLYDLLEAYRRQCDAPKEETTLSIKPLSYTIQDALRDICRYCAHKEVDYSFLSMLQSLSALKGKEREGGQVTRRERLIVVLSACLELSKNGFLHVRQADDMVDIRMKRA